MLESEARELLAVTPTASMREVKAAYRGALKRWHPDLFPADTGPSSEAVVRTQRLNEAYRLLVNEGGSPDANSQRATSAAPSWDGSTSWWADHRFEVTLVIGCIVLIAASALIGQVLGAL